VETAATATTLRLLTTAAHGLGDAAADELELLTTAAV
jgi:hypothetical protein